jgi:peroxiredoxin
MQEPMIQVGQKLPEYTFRVVTEEGPATRSTTEIFGGKKVVLFAVPGAFTPTCSNNHLPGYITYFDAMKAKGVDTVAVLAVNDIHVMGAWAKSTGALGRIEFLADGSAEFTKAIGTTLDRIAAGLGIRSQRYSMLVEDGVVKTFNVEDGGAVEASSASTMLTQL